MLPHLNGPDLAAQLRLDQPHLRVIHMSGWFDHPDFPRLGDGVLLAKPFSIDELRETVARTLSSA